MTTAYEIPFGPQPQDFTIALGGVSYRLATRWCEPMQAWGLDIYAADGVALVTGIPIVTGTDLLGQYAYLGIAGRIFVQSSGEVTAVPGFDELGEGGHVFFVTEP